MTRVLKTIRDCERLFPFVYEGFLAGGNRQQGRNVEKMRLERNILRKLRSVSLDTGQMFPNTDIPQRALTGPIMEGFALLEFTQPELDMLVSYMEHTNWLVHRVELAIDAIDWVRSAGVQAEE